MRWGMISTGRIARVFLDALRSSESEQVVAVASRDADKAAETAREFGVARPYGNYEALLADPEVQAVYIAAPNSLHAEWTLKTAQAGKHILCEKPLGVRPDEAAAMFSAARCRRVADGSVYVPLVETLDNMATIDALLRSTRAGHAVEVAG